MNGCIDKALALEIHQYDKNVWEHLYNSKNADGYVMAEKERLVEATKSKNEKEKFNKEFRMCCTAADNGFKVEYLHGENRLSGQTYDIHLNNLRTDLKSTGGMGNIVGYAGDAYEHQGAEAVLFELQHDLTTKPKIMEKFAEIKRKYPIRIFYYFYNDTGRRMREFI